MRASSALSEQITVVVATRDRADQLLSTLDRLRSGADPPAVIVVDNASSDDTAWRVRAAHPGVQLIGLDRNEGATARNIGAATAATPVVAFNDDDSWWQRASLVRAVEAFSRHRRLALAAARVLVGPEDRLDPVSETMATSPLADAHPDLPGVPVLGFLACAAAVRRDAFLAVGGFSRLLFFAGEEDLVAMDLASHGWAVRYLEDLVVHHRPTPQGRDRSARRILLQRNALLTTWLRRPGPVAARATTRLAMDAIVDADARRALGAAMARAPAARRQRRPVSQAVETGLAQLEPQRGPAMGLIARAPGRRDKIPSPAPPEPT